MSPLRARLIHGLCGALTVGVGLVGAGCGSGESGSGGKGDSGGRAGVVARAQLNNAEGRPAGSVSLRQADEGLAVRVRASGLEPGFHGFHVHESGVCDPKARAEGKPMPFASAGPHLSRGGSPHGEHAGDLPPILVGADGTASANVVVRSFSVDELTADDATAFIVHADPDNLANIPDRYAVDGEGGPDAETLETGDSANRVACGKVARTG